jgi:hypothetical protein
MHHSIHQRASCVYPISAALATGQLVPLLVGKVDRSVDLSQERHHSEFYDPLELRVQCAALLSALLLIPVSCFSPLGLSAWLVLIAANLHMHVSLCMPAYADNTYCCRAGVFHSSCRCKSGGRPQPHGETRAHLMVLGYCDGTHYDYSVWGPLRNCILEDPFAQHVGASTNFLHSVSPPCAVPERCLCMSSWLQPCTCLPPPPPLRLLGGVSVMPLGCTLGNNIKVWQRVISHNDLRCVQVHTRTHASAFDARSSHMLALSTLSSQRACGYI